MCGRPRNKRARVNKKSNEDVGQRARQLVAINLGLFVNSRPD